MCMYIYIVLLWESRECGRSESVLIFPGNTNINICCLQSLCVWRAHTLIKSRGSPTLWFTESMPIDEVPFLFSCAPKPETEERKVRNAGFLLQAFQFHLWLMDSCPQMMGSCLADSSRGSCYPRASFLSHSRRWPRSSEVERTAEDTKESQREEGHEGLPLGRKNEESIWKG